MELRHLRYFCAVADHGSFSEAGRQLHVSQSAISEQIADLEREVGGALVNRTSAVRGSRRMASSFLPKRARPCSPPTAPSKSRTARSSARSARSVSAFFCGAREVSLRASSATTASSTPTSNFRSMRCERRSRWRRSTAGKIDVAFARPLEPPFDRTLRAELLYRDPIVVVLPRDHPLAGKPISIDALIAERFVLCDRHMTPALFDGIVALCSAAGFSPNIVNTSATWSGVLTLVESGEGVALVPSGVRYLRPLRRRHLSAGSAEPLYGPGGRVESGE